MLTIRFWLWCGVLAGAASVAGAQDIAATQRHWPQPAPKQKNVLHRVLFPERPSVELDDSAGTIARLVAELNADDDRRAGEAFKQLFWIGEPARRVLQPLVERAQSAKHRATRHDSRAYKALYAIDHFAFYRAVTTPLKLDAPVTTAAPVSMRSKRWSRGVIGKPKAVTLEVNTQRCVTYGMNYRGMELIIVNRSGRTIEVGRAGMRMDCVAEAETADGWVAIEAPPVLDRRAPKVWKLRHDFAAESAVPLYGGSLATRLRYRLTIRGAQAPVYSNIFSATISPAQLTGKTGRLDHDHTPR